MKKLLCFLIVMIWGQGASAQCVSGSNGIAEACFDKPATAGYYGHNILGNTPEWTALRLKDSKGASHKITLPHNIFEDITPRLADMDGDGIDDVIVVETDPDRGARLAIYSIAPKVGLLAATDYIGRSHRWLAPVGMADFNGDGQMDVAFVDRPHLVQTLRVWTLKSGKLVEIAWLPSVTNHRIGDQVITSGIRDCGAGVEMLMISTNWKDLLAVRFDGDQLVKRKIGRNQNARSMKRALACKMP